MTDDQEKYTTLLLLHNIFFYSNYAGRFTAIVAAILRGESKYAMAPYAGVYSIREMNYQSENSDSPLSDNSAKNFQHVVHRAQGWDEVEGGTSAIYGAIQSHQTTMFSHEEEGRKSLNTTKGSGS